MSTSERKRGKLSREEEQLINNNLASMSNEEIGELINRSPETVAKYRAQAPVVAQNGDGNAIIQQLHKKFFWAETKEQLVGDRETEFFERYWASLVLQFASQGILPTDELMMRDLIISEININRCLRAKSSIMRELDLIEKQQDDVYKQYPDDPLSRLPLLEPLHNRANAIRGSVRAYTDEWKMLQDKKDKKLDQLKATRQTRLEKIEKSGRSFVDLVKMLDSPEIREKEGRLNELYKAAAELAKLRFEQVVRYENEQFDRAFLTPEAEDRDAQEENNKQEKINRDSEQEVVS
jgi:hypothetical protein